MMTVEQLISEIKKPGDIYADVNSADDSYCWKQNKKEIIYTLERFEKNDRSPWVIIVDYNGDRILHPQD